MKSRFWQDFPDSTAPPGSHVALGQSSADLENQRDASRADLAKLIDVRAVETPSGDLLLATPSGISLPTRFLSPPFTLDAATLDRLAAAKVIHQSVPAG